MTTAMPSWICASSRPEGSGAAARGGEAAAAGSGDAGAGETTVGFARVRRAKKKGEGKKVNGRWGGEID